MERGKVRSTMVDAARIEVRRGKNESSSALIRRFSRRAQGLGLVREMRDRRYWKRSKSKNVDHKRALISLSKRARYQELVKLGKIDPSARRSKRGRK
jgi:ribosomal protein S21